MNGSEKVKVPFLQLERYVWVLAVLWTIVIPTSLVWHVVQTKQETLEEAQIQARTAYEKDVTYRRWNAGHGGVYVPVTEKTQPNPHLSDVPERDITTPSGKALTLMNPAYMTRQAHELEKQKLGVRGHITSLNPIRPENTPDSWETEALRTFERGKTEISSVEKLEGKEYMRLMRPLITEKGCLKCHAKQGYHEGDIRGGISVSIPMEPFLAIERRHILTFALVYGLLWMVGLSGIVLGTVRLRRSERKRTRAEEALRKAHDELEIRVQERTAQLAKSNEALLKVNRAYKTLSVCNQVLVHTTDESVLLYDICRAIVEAGGYLMALVGYAEQDEQKTVRAVAQMGYEENFLKTVNLTWADTERGHGPLGTAIRTRTHSIFQNIANESKIASWREAALKRGYASAIGLPLIIDSDLLGALAIYSVEPYAFDMEEVKLLTELVDDLAYGIMTLRTRTERKKAEEALKRSHDELEIRVRERTKEIEDANLELQVLNKELNFRRKEAEDAKLKAMAATRAKSDFLANMSHELRTPLNAIIGFSDMMFQGMTGKLTEQQHDYLGDIRESGEILLSLINDILDLSKVEAGKTELELSEFNLKELIERSLVMFKEKAMKHNIKVKYEVDERIVSVTADERRLKQVMFNLLSNAVKFTPDGGSVRVKARLVNSEQYLVNSKKLFTDDYSLTTNRDFIEISVEDTGIGIRPEDFDKLFQPFQQLEYTLTKKYEGTGLGLTLCKRIVELHNGRIWVESEVGKGSKFIFVIPAKQKT